MIRLTDDDLKKYNAICQRDDWHNHVQGSEVRLMLAEIELGRAQIEKLKTCLEPGKASAIVNGIFELAFQCGMSWTSSRAPTAFIVDKIRALEVRILELEEPNEEA